MLSRDGRGMLPSRSGRGHGMLPSRGGRGISLSRRGRFMRGGARQGGGHGICPAQWCRGDRKGVRRLVWRCVGLGFV